MSSDGARPDEPPRATWEWVLKILLYKFEGEASKAIGPFERLVAWVAQSSWADRTYASRQLHWLHISVVSNWDEHYRHPYLVVEPKSETLDISRWIPKATAENGAFFVRPECVGRIVVPMGDAWDSLTAGLEWLTSPR